MTRKKTDAQRRRDEWEKREQVRDLQRRLDGMIERRGMVLLIKDETRNLDKLIKKKGMVMIAPRLAKTHRKHGIRKTILESREA